MKLKKIWKIVFGLIGLLIVLLITGIIVYNYELSPVDKKDSKEVVFVIEKGTSTKNIAKDLKGASLIHNEKFFLFYVKLHRINNLQASTYKLKRSNSMKEIINIISNGDGFNPEEIKITFK